MKEKLYLKGHSQRRIAIAEQILKKAEKRKHPRIRHVENSMFWFTLATGILGSALLSFAIIPVLVAGTIGQGMLVAFVFGLLLGMMIRFMTGNMNWLEDHHHLSITFVIPLIALFNFFIIGVVVNQFNRAYGMQSQHNPVFLGVMYFLGFLVPFAVLAFVKGVRR